MNKRTVWVTYNDRRKNMSNAEKFGELKDVFSSIGKEYNPDKLIQHARTVLKNWQPGDYLLVVGDPALVGICMVVISEIDDEINLLKWDRINFEYIPMTLNFMPQKSPA